MEVKIQFSEAQKAITALVVVIEEVATEEEQSKLMLKAKEIFEAAMAYSKMKTMEKMR